MTFVLSNVCKYNWLYDGLITCMFILTQCIFPSIVYCIAQIQQGGSALQKEDLLSDSSNLMVVSSQSADVLAAVLLYLMLVVQLCRDIWIDDAALSTSIPKFYCNH